MKGERRLSLVRPPAGQEPAGSDAADEPLLPPASADEIEAAQALARALDEGWDPVLGALVAAYRPKGLGPAAHEAILSRALGISHEQDSIDVPPSSSERAEAEHLRAALDEQGAGDDPQQPAAGVAAMLRSAYRPRDIAPLRNEALIARALSGSRSRSSRKMLPVTMVAMSGLVALAAGFAVLFLRPHAADLNAPGSVSASAAHTPMIRSRSTIDLFDPTTPFARTGGQSARIDRIASARAAELRENRFVAWGVR